jgi:hypothetical protein
MENEEMPEAGEVERRGSLWGLGEELHHFSEVDH